MLSGAQKNQRVVQQVKDVAPLEHIEQLEIVGGPGVIRRTA